MHRRETLAQQPDPVQVPQNSSAVEHEGGTRRRRAARPSRRWRHNPGGRGWRDSGPTPPCRRLREHGSTGAAPRCRARGARTARIPPRDRPKDCRFALANRRPIWASVGSKIFCGPARQPLPIGEAPRVHVEIAHLAPVPLAALLQLAAIAPCRSMAKGNHSSRAPKSRSERDASAFAR